MSSIEIIPDEKLIIDSSKILEYPIEYTNTSNHQASETETESQNRISEDTSSVIKMLLDKESEQQEIINNLKIQLSILQLNISKSDFQSQNNSLINMEQNTSPIINMEQNNSLINMEQNTSLINTEQNTSPIINNVSIIESSPSNKQETPRSLSKTYEFDSESSDSSYDSFSSLEELNDLKNSSSIKNSGLYQLVNNKNSRLLPPKNSTSDRINNHQVQNFQNYTPSSSNKIQKIKKEFLPLNIKPFSTKNNHIS